VDVRAYDELATLAEREREAVVAGRADELEALRARREALVASLPAQAPPEARPALERAERAQAEAVVALRDAVAEARRALDAVGQGRRATRGYSQAAGSSRHDLRR
jgi:hypothetical protein